jgi:hypothetical protein
LAASLGDWAVRAAVVEAPTEAMVARRIGVVGLADSLPLPLGQCLSAAPVGQWRRAQWTGTDRVSWVWGGHQLFNDRGDDWRGWLGQHWASLGQRPASAPAPAPATPVPAPAWDLAA